MSEKHFQGSLQTCAMTQRFYDVDEYIRVLVCFGCLEIVETGLLYYSISKRLHLSTGTHANCVQRCAAQRQQWRSCSGCVGGQHPQRTAVATHFHSSGPPSAAFQVTSFGYYITVRRSYVNTEVYIYIYASRLFAMLLRS